MEGCHLAADALSACGLHYGLARAPHRVPAPLPDQQPQSRLSVPLTFSDSTVKMIGLFSCARALACASHTCLNLSAELPAQRGAVLAHHSTWLLYDTLAVADRCITPAMPQIYLRNVNKEVLFRRVVDKRDVKRTKSHVDAQTVGPAAAADRSLLAHCRSCLAQQAAVHDAAPHAALRFAPAACVQGVGSFAVPSPLDLHLC